MQKCKMDYAKKENGLVENVEPIPDINTNINTNSKPYNNIRFIPPTLEEVAAYCFERQNTVDPEHFIDYYTTNGWKVGKNKMKDWKASVRTWERNSYGKNTQKKQTGNQFFDLLREEGKL